MKFMKTRKRKQKRAFLSTAVILCLFLQAGIQVGVLGDDKKKKEKVEAATEETEEKTEEAQEEGRTQRDR